MNRFFKPISASFLGDYGDIAINGMCDHLPETKDGYIQLERGGPFIPSMTLPSSSIIVTDQLRSQLLNHLEIEFRPVVKAHIVQFDWSSFDDMKIGLAKLPLAVPEALLLSRPHCEETSVRMGDLWELRPAIGGAQAVIKEGAMPWNYAISIRANSWGGHPLFLTAGGIQTFAVSREGRDLLDELTCGEIQFLPIGSL